MTDRDVEVQLRDYFRTEGGDESASQDLLARVSAIPDGTRVGLPAGRRLWLLAAAALLLAALLAEAIGAGSSPLHRNPSLGIVVPTPPAASATSGSGSAATAQIDVNGQTRAYTVVAPPDVAVLDPLPLLVLLHGGNVSTPAAESTGGFDALAVGVGAVVVYPEGYANSWNAGTCCRPATTDALDDVGFIGALIDHLEADYPIDPNRVFIAGDGTGGSMAYRVACELSSRFAAVAVVSGPLLVDCSPARPIPVLHIHGDADTLFLYEGGGTACDGPCPSVAQTMERWRQADGCTGDPSMTTEGIVVTTTFSTCAGGAEVEFVTANGLDTTWGVTGIDDRAVIWSFLMDHAP
jgi:polyhydroxybutyrate depolymerase